MNLVNHYLNDFLHLFFPHLCIGCKQDVLNDKDALCSECASKLPETGFFDIKENPVEKIFYGRLRIEHAASAFYFTKDSVIQRAIVQLKYKNNHQAGYHLGKLLGNKLAASKRFCDVDIIIPTPLNDKKLFKRGYNQSAVIVNGITGVWKKPVVENAVERILFTETQTHKNRISRWETMEGVFKVSQPEQIKNKHVLLVDDVVTTGATLEACGEVILKTPGTRLSIITVAYTI